MARAAYLRTDMNAGRTSNIEREQKNVTTGLDGTTSTAITRGPGVIRGPGMIRGPG
jgi:hypothetical protein